MRGVCNEVWWCPFPTSRQPPDHHCLTPALTHTQGNLVTLGIRLPSQSSAVGGQVPDVGLPHCRDARIQHSQSRQPALPGVTTVVAPRRVPASTDEVFPASPTQSRNKCSRDKTRDHLDKRRFCDVTSTAEHTKRSVYFSAAGRNITGKTRPIDIAPHECCWTAAFNAASTRSIYHHKLSHMSFGDDP